MIAMLSVIRGSGESPVFAICYGIAVGFIVAIYILWDRRYRRKWEQFRARGWARVEGEFLPGSGETVRMMKGRSEDVAGFEAWLDYRYQDGAELEGTYRRFFGTKQEAQGLIALLEGQRIPVSVSPRKPSISRVLDSDVDQLIERLGGLPRLTG
jgi:hypothetical protein